MAVATEVELCNHALSLIGESRISSLTEANERARICNLLYDQTRDELLASFEWPFAVERRALSAVDEENLTQWGYSYSLPPDYLKMLDVLDDESYRRVMSTGYGLGGHVSSTDMFYLNRRVATHEEPFYRIQGNRLYTDFSPCYVRYIARVENPVLFPELFVTALAASLAAKVAPRLSQNFQLAQTMMQYAGAAIVTAKAELTKDAQPRPRKRNLWSEYN
jgi:hypothetical protein